MSYEQDKARQKLLKLAKELQASGLKVYLHADTENTDGVRMTFHYEGDTTTVQYDPSDYWESSDCSWDDS